jgi:hypothetical protein
LVFSWVLSLGGGTLGAGGIAGFIKL